MYKALHVWKKGAKALKLPPHWMYKASMVSWIETSWARACGGMKKCASLKSLKNLHINAEIGGQMEFDFGKGSKSPSKI